MSEPVVAPVLPAHAGMIRDVAAINTLGKGAPRSRGDDPPVTGAVIADRTCSPLTRG